MPDVDIEGPDGKTYSFPDGTDKAAAIKYFHAKGIGAAKPITPPKMTVGAPSSSSMHPSFLIGDPNSDATPQSFGDQVKGVAKSTVNLTPPGIAATLVKARTPGWISQHVPYGSDIEREAMSPHDLINQAGMMVALPAAEGIAEGRVASTSAFTGPRGRTVPEPPKAAPLDTESQAKYTAAIDKTNAEFKEGARAYHEKVSKTFDESKREQLEYDRKQRLEAGSKAATRATYDNLQKTYKTARGSLDQRWGQFRQAMEGAELEPTKAFNNIEDAKAKYLKGSPASLQVFNNLAREMGIQEFMEGDGGALKAIPGSGKLPFDTARVHYSAIGDKLAQGNLPGNVYQALKAVEDGLDKQLTQAAESRNLGKDYTELKANESQFRKDWVDPKSPLARAYKALDENFLEPHVMGRGTDYLTKQLERYRQYGAEPDLPLSARRMMEESKAIKAKPGVPEGTVPTKPTLKEVPRPKPAPPKASKLARATGRVAGKIIGGTIGSKLGHPLVGYGIGGELGTEAAEGLARPRTVPEPPDE